jgi:hypothetical protein
MENKQRFQEWIAGLSEVFNKDLSPALVKIYWQVLSGYSDEQCEAAFQKVLSQNEYFPKPAQLIEILNPDVSKELASLHAGYLINAIQGREYKNPKSWKDDPVTKILITGRFNIERLYRDSLESDLKWIIKDFIEAYKELSDTEQLQIENSGEQKRLT